MKERTDVWSYIFDKKGVTVKSDRKYRTLQMTKLYASKAMQENRFQISELYHKDRLVGYLRNEGCGNFSITPIEVGTTL